MQAIVTVYHIVLFTVAYQFKLKETIMKFGIVNTHISTIRAGDTVEHEGKIMTVCHKDIKKDAFFGTTLFGDSYRIGQQPVKKVNIFHAKPTK